MKPTCLTIAGIDNCAAAGIYNDLKTFHHLGCYGTAAITTITVQTIQNVIKIEPVKDSLLEEQLSSLFSTFNIDAIKTGMIYKKSHFKIIKKYLVNFKKPTVIDPILYSTSGTSFLEQSAITDLIDLFSLVSLVTPNIPEVLFLLNKNQAPSNLNDLKKLSYDFFNQFRVPVLLKGGHFNSNDIIYDIFFDGEEFFILKTRKIHKKHIRGTGCTLSAAIITFLAKKYPLKMAVHYAKKYIVSQIKKATPYKPYSDYYLILHE